MSRFNRRKSTEIFPFAIREILTSLCRRFTEPLLTVAKVILVVIIVVVRAVILLRTEAVIVATTTKRIQLLATVHLCTRRIMERLLLLSFCGNETA